MKKKNDPVALFHQTKTSWKKDKFLTSRTDLKEGRKLELQKRNQNYVWDVKWFCRYLYFGLHMLTDFNDWLFIKLKKMDTQRSLLTENDIVENAFSHFLVLLELHFAW